MFTKALQNWKEGTNLRTLLKNQRSLVGSVENMKLINIGVPKKICTKSPISIKPYPNLEADLESSTRVL